jgi:hypothetical protein
MRRLRVSVAGLMAVVAFAAVIFAALGSASAFWVSVSFTMAVAVLYHGSHEPVGPHASSVSQRADGIHRKFGLLDGMMLVAGTAIGLAIWRAWYASVWWSRIPGSSLKDFYRSLGSASLLAPWSVTLLGMALRHPRPSLRRLALSPALAVGLAVSLVVCAEAVIVLAALLIMGIDRFVSATINQNMATWLYQEASFQIGAAVAVTFAVQAMIGSGRRKPSWLDLMGWFLGACWILLAFGSTLFRLLLQG